MQYQCIIENLFSSTLNHLLNKGYNDFLKIATTPDFA